MSWFSLNADFSARAKPASSKTTRCRSVAAMAFTVIWYGKQGVVEKMPFDAEKAARDHALATFPARKQNGIVAVEVRKEDGTVVFSQAGARSD
jgi:hypothetical protein